MSYYRQQLEEWLKGISVKAERVLDIGGASNPVRSRLKSWEVSECIFFDNGAEEAKVDYMPFDINVPIERQFAGYYRDGLENGMPTVVVDGTFKFNAIFCLEVFEYVWNPVQAIKNIYDLMTKDSVAYISFPAIYPVHNPVEIDYLRYTRAVIEKYLKDNLFDRVEITPRVATAGRAELGAFYRSEGMHPVRGSELPYDIGYLVKAVKLS